ncbi:MAG: outer membrane protein [Candidatus Berkiella sp.]
MDIMHSKLTTFVSLTCTCLLTANCYAEPGNLLIGAIGGYSSARSSVDVTALYRQPNALFAGIPPSTVIEDYKEGGFLGGILAGYQAQCENWILGAELKATWENYNDETTFSFSDVSVAYGGNGFGFNGSMRYQREVTFEFALRFGYELESLMLFFPPVFIPYMRVGVQTSKDTIEATYNGDPAVYPFTTSSTYKRWPYRFVAGIGTEFPVTPQLSLRFEYNYVSAGQNMETIGYIQDGGIINPSFATAMNPIIQSGTMALVWNFR